jgi:hypothetical protein
LFGVEELRALAAGALGDEQPEPRQRGWVILNHLHVHERRPDAIGHGDPVAGADEGVRGRVVDLAVAAGDKDHRLGGERLHGAVPDVAGHGAGDAAILVLHQRGREPLLVPVDLLVLHQLLVENMQDRLAGDVGHVVGARGGGAAESALAEPAFLVSVEGHAEVLQVENLAGSLAAHDLDCVLVAQVVRALDRVERMRLPRVLRVERRVYPTLCRVRMGPDRVDLGDDPHRRALPRRGEGGALTGKAGSYDEDVVLGHLRGLGRFYGMCGRRPMSSGASLGPLGRNADIEEG